MNLPNKITLSRVLLIPVFMIVIFGNFDFGQIKIFDYSLSVAHLIGTVIFAVLSLTDWIDGHLARKLNLVTNFGKFLDPLADKLLMTAGFVALVEMQVVPAWMVILILSREFAVTGLRLVASNEGVVIAADKLGKIKTTVQILTIILFLLGLNNLFVQLLLWFTLIITVYSGIEYFRKSKDLFSKSM